MSRRSRCNCAAAWLSCASPAGDAAVSLLPAHARSSSQKALSSTVAEMIAALPLRARKSGVSRTRVDNR